MKKFVFIVFILMSLTACSVDFNWEADKKIELINSSPTCVFKDTYFICIWWNGVCKDRNFGSYASDHDWHDCWNALK